MRPWNFLALPVLLAALPGAASPAPASPPRPPAAHAAAPARVEDGADAHLPAGRFGTVSVYIPQGPPKSVAIFLSGDGGWELGVINMARALRNMGAVVIGANVRNYLASLGAAARRPAAPCQPIAQDFEALSHQVQKEIGMREYHVPVLVGYSSGATIVYGALVQSPPGTFAGALSLGFCADQDFAGAELCPGAGLHYTPNKQRALVLAPATTLRQPWIALQGQKDEVCSAAAVDEFAAHVTNGEVVRLPLVGHGFSVERNWMPQFRAAYSRLSAPAPAATRPADISDLPVTEVPARGPTDELAV
ncbi:MAG TPA: AcvB/VirJ family lysyl-phosphatidylglycerol hydrolase, partial [Steroidobacteraceae bacterium]|nr:AcvB/VirJ family lysyl-phosphatidylglycerol hydrolase [Steroidobacteraceae bacterium]